VCVLKEICISKTNEPRLGLAGAGFVWRISILWWSDAGPALDPPQQAGDDYALYYNDRSDHCEADDLGGSVCDGGHVTKGEKGWRV
jgi:hypothetical protein